MVKYRKKTHLKNFRFFDNKLIKLSIRFENNNRFEMENDKM